MMEPGLRQTELFQLLQGRCQAMKPGPLDGELLIGTVLEATKTLGDLLNRSYRTFEDFTLPDEHHAVRVVHLMHRVMGQETSAQLHEIDLTLLIFAAFAHDVGMVAENDERERIVGTAEFKEFTVRHESRWIAAQKARDRGDAEGYQRAHAQLFQAYLRERHHKRSAEMVCGRLATLFDVGGISLADAVAALSNSHGEPVSTISQLRSMPFGTVYESDLPYLACVLRLADQLDLDPARAPRALLEITKPRGKTSLTKWLRYRGNFTVSDTLIDFRASLTDFFEEKSLRDTLRELDRERQECVEFLEERSPDLRRLRLARPIGIHIESNGYLYEEFRFQLEYEQIMSLLMGTQLYRDERAFVRELLQNAIDACRYASAAAAAVGRQGPPATIAIRRWTEAPQREIIEVADEGAGMTREIVRDYFMRVGRSFYQSFAFRRRQLQMDPISQFGIGILSCFMNSGYLEVDTCPDPLAYPRQAGLENEALTLEIRGAQEFFVVRPSERKNPGTAVRVHLTKGMDESLDRIVKHFLARVPFDIRIEDYQQPGIQFHNVSFDLSGQGFDDAYTTLPAVFTYQHLDHEFDGKFGFGLHGRMRFFLFSVDGEVRLQWNEIANYSALSFTAIGEAVAVAKTFTQAAHEAFYIRINRVREMTANFQEEIAADLSNILRNVDQLLQNLVDNSNHDVLELRWNALAAQLNVVSMAGMFQAHPLSLIVERELSQLIRELKAYLAGRVTLGAPAGIITQDGLNLFGLDDFTAQLSLGLGYLYNLDLCGQYRFSLNPARDAVAWDEGSKRVCVHLQDQVGRRLGTWFRDLGILKEQVERYAESSPEPLRDAVWSSYSGRT
jgi:HD domain